MKATIDFALHRNARARADLALAPALQQSPEGQVLAADLDLQEGRYDTAGKATCVSSPTATLGRARPAGPPSSSSWATIAQPTSCMRRPQTSYGEAAAVVRMDRAPARRRPPVARSQRRGRAPLPPSAGGLQRRLGRGRAPRRAPRGRRGGSPSLSRSTTASSSGSRGRSCNRRSATSTPSPAGRTRRGRGTTVPSRATSPPSRAAILHYLHHLASFYADVRIDGAAALRFATLD